MPCPISQDIYDRLLEALQPAEELGGPEEKSYADLMLRIAAECLRRANAMAEAQGHRDLAGFAGPAQFLVENFRSELQAAHGFDVYPEPRTTH
ncbi:hypothetical protein R2571_005735 [Pseudomonas aeruginosa]|nr:hypothetical protein [Pseudomonas aeruginosa]